jgi:hypothetical protein
MRLPRCGALARSTPGWTAALRGGWALSFGGYAMRSTGSPAGPCRGQVPRQPRHVSVDERLGLPRHRAGCSFPEWEHGGTPARAWGAGGGYAESTADRSFVRTGRLRARRTRRARLACGRDAGHDTLLGLRRRTGTSRRSSTATSRDENHWVLRRSRRTRSPLARTVLWSWLSTARGPAALPRRRVCSAGRPAAPRGALGSPRPRRVLPWPRARSGSPRAIFSGYSRSRRPPPAPPRSS